MQLFTICYDQIMLEDTLTLENKITDGKTFGETGKTRLKEIFSPS